MDVSESGATKRNGYSNSGPEKKIKRNRKNRSAKQIERARKYRERNNYHIDARDIIKTDPTHPTICHTKNEFGQHLNRHPMNPPLQFAGLFLPGATESHPPAYFLCPGMVPNVPWNMSNIGTIIQKPVSNAEVFVPTSTNKSNIETIVQDPVSNLRATAKEFVPALARKVDSTFKSHEDNNIEKVLDTLLEIDKTRDGIKLNIDETNKLLKTIDIPEHHLTAVNIDNKVPENNYKHKDHNATTYEDRTLSDSNKEERIITGSSDTINGDNRLEDPVFLENSTPEDDESDTNSSDSILEDPVFLENSTPEDDESDTNNSDNILEDSVFLENSTPEDGESDTNNNDSILEDPAFLENNTPEDDESDTNNSDNILEDPVFLENSTPEDDESDTNNSDNILEDPVFLENSTPEDDESDTNNSDNILEDPVFLENSTPEDDESDTNNSDNILEDSLFPENSKPDDDIFSILQVFASSSLHCALNMCREATHEEMTLKHSEEQVEKLKSTENMTEEDLKEMSKKYDFIYFHPLIFESAKLALGGTLELVKAVLHDEIQNGLAIIRPPGHHAQHNTYCGYSYLNNVATAAQIALDDFGLHRILILDWDVHHGQGTQYMYYDDPRVLMFSIHTYDDGREWPCLRESDYDYIGSGQGTGYNINVPLNKSGCGNDEYMAIFQQLLLPVAYEFSPELVLVSAGYDSAIGCPEGEMEVTPAMYAHFVSLLSSLACGKICLIQEGGYCVKSLSESIALSLRALLGDPTPLLAQSLKEGGPDESVVNSILNAIKMLRPYWKCLRFQDDLPETDVSEENRFIELPPKPGVKFYTDGMPETFDLYEPCYDEEYEDQKQGLYARIDSLISNTSLDCAPHRVGIISDLKMLLHKDPSGECEEQGERVSFCCEKLRSEGLWGRCQEIPSRQATVEELSLAHRPEYVNLMSKMSDLSDESVQKYQRTFDSVYICQSTYLAATTAVGCLLNAVDNVLSGKSQSSVAVIRPPGHHATPNAAYGFCIFNNVGIAAKYIRQKYPDKRVLIVDWDLHHGNGTQDLFYEDRRLLYLSIHRHDCGTFFPCGCNGSHTHTGKGAGKGYNVNIPWNKGTRSDGDYIAAFNQVVMPIAYQFGPDVVLISAGFDACTGDQLGCYKVSPACFGHLTKMLSTLANGNLIMALEGGYNLECTASAISACVSALLGDRVPSISSVVLGELGISDIKKVLDVQGTYWSSLKFRVQLPTQQQLRLVRERKRKTKDQK